MLILDNYARRSDPLLLDFLKSKKASFGELTPYSLNLLEKLEEFCLSGGKRLRPALVYYGYLLLGGKDGDDIVKASMAVELIHAFLLIHDDIMDESVLRRGKPTMHKLFEKDGDKKFGESIGILAGDLSQCLAFNMLFDTDFPPELKLTVAKKLNEIIITTIFGQELDLRMETKNNPKLQDILTLYRLKTAKYTFECPLHVGALLAGAGPRDLELLTACAIPLGIAFQIQDDILGLFGAERETGKPEGDDIRQGKKTLLIVKALEQSGNAERKRLEELLGKKNLSSSELEKARAIIKKTGALDYVQELSKKQLKLARKAYDAMRKRSYDREAIDILESIADFVIERKL